MSSAYEILQGIWRDNAEEIQRMQNVPQGPYASGYTDGLHAANARIRAAMAATSRPGFAQGPAMSQEQLKEFIANQFAASPHSYSGPHDAYDETKVRGTIGSDVLPPQRLTGPDTV